MRGKTHFWTAVQFTVQVKLNAHKQTRDGAKDLGRFRLQWRQCFRSARQDEWFVEALSLLGNDLTNKHAVPK